MKERIQKLIDIYANSAFRTTNEVGFNTPSLLGHAEYIGGPRNSWKKKQLNADFSAADESQAND